MTTPQAPTVLETGIWSLETGVWSMLEEPAPPTRLEPSMIGRLVSLAVSGRKGSGEVQRSVAGRLRSYVARAAYFEDGTDLSWTDMRDVKLTIKVVPPQADTKLAAEHAQVETLHRAAFRGEVGTSLKYSVTKILVAGSPNASRAARVVKRLHHGR